MLGVSWNVYQLSLLTASYVVGELSHFLIGVTSRDVAREIHYGDSSCFPIAAEDAFSLCATAKGNETRCASLPGCRWDYTGLGLDYQLLAGPSFIAVFTVSGVVLGVTADFVSRTRLLGAAVLIFSLSTMATGMATEYWHLVVLRMTLAAGEAACSPIGVSLISDLFTARHRGTATGIFHWGIYFGYGLSYTIGVYLTRADVAGLGWRCCFLLAGFPGLLIGVLLLLSPDVARGGGGGEREPMSDVNDNDLALEERKAFMEQASPISTWTVISTRLRNTLASFLQPVLILLFVAASFRHAAGFSFAYNARLYFLSYYPTFDVGAWISWVSILGGSLGVFLGGFISDKIVERLGLAARLYVLGISMLVASPFAFGVLYLSPPSCFLALIAYYIFAETWFAILFVVLVELVPSSVKTSILGIFLFLMNNTGGNVPVLVDPMSKAIGYRETLYVFFPGFVAISGVLFLISSLPIRRKSSR